MWRLILALILLPAEIFAVGKSTDSLKSELIQVGDSKQKLDILQSITAQYKQMPVHDALKHIEIGIQLAKKLSDPFYEAIFENRKGVVLMRIGSYESAIQSNFRALDLYRKIGRNDRCVAVLINIGVIYKKQDQFDLALEYYRKALSFLGDDNKLDNKRAIIFNNIGIIHRHRKNQDSAMYYYNKSIAYNIEGGRQSGLGDNFSNLALLHQENGKYDSALYFFEKTLSIRRALNDTFGILHAQWQIGSTLLHKSNLDNGIKIYYTIKASAEALQFPTILTGVYNDLYEYHKMMNRPDSALYYLERHQELETRLKNAEISEMLAIRNEAMLRDENESLRGFNRLQSELLSREKTYNLTLLGAVCFLLLLSGVLFVIYNENKKKARVLQNQKEKIARQNNLIEQANQQLSLINKDLQKVNTEMEQIVSLIAHDMKSPVDQIKGLSEILKMEMTPEIQQQHADFFIHLEAVTDRQYQLINNIIQSYKRQKQGPSEHLDLHDELMRLVERYSILAAKKEIQIQTSFSNLSATTNSDKEKLVRIIENIISNAIKYSPVGETIIISTQIFENHLELSIKDKGPGIPLEKQEAFRAGLLINPDAASPDSHGIGLSIVRRFTEELGISVEIDSSSAIGTCFRLKIPKNKD